MGGAQFARVSTNGLPSPDRYGIIGERNSFRLRSETKLPVTPAEKIEPKEDLFLTGVVAGFFSNRRALFIVTAPGKAPLSFGLCEGEQNEWLELRSVNPQRGTVTALLKKPI